MFDTVLVRAVGHPDGVFHLLGRLQAAQALTDLSPEAFARARKDAQDRAHATHRERVSLDHILAELGWGLGLAPGGVERLRAQELALETSLVRAVPGAADWLDRLGAAGGRRVVFASDTYLPGEVVRGLLTAHGLWRDGDGLYVSCEVGREKHTGRLFRVIARKEGVARRRLRHYGNDPAGDVAAARRAGVRATPVPAANLDRYELLLDRWRDATGGMASLLAGASRLARLTIPVADGTEAAVRDVTAGVAAPTLVAYVLWLLADAARAGLGRLYFVSRDGQVLLDVARRLAPSIPMAAGLELRYLYGSRQAWSAPALQRVSWADLGWIFSDPTFLSVRTALGRLGVSPVEVEADLGAAGLPPAMWEEHLSRARRARLVRLVTAGPVHRLVLDRAAATRSLLERYLEQAGLCDGTPYGVVDVGWTGRTGGALDSVVSRTGAPGRRVFYYLGLRQRPRGSLDCRPWLFDDAAGRGPDLRRVAVAPLVEAFCTGSHGLVLGFADDDGTAAPVLRTSANDEAAACGLAVVRATLDAFLDAVVLAEPLADLGADLRPPVAAVLGEFGRHPTRAEAVAWGRWPYSADPNEAHLGTLAEPYRWADAAAVVALGPLRRTAYRPWPAASRRLSPAPVSWVMGRPADLATRARRALTSANAGRRRQPRVQSFATGPDGRDGPLE